jgi:ribosomal protein L37E
MEQELLTIPKNHTTCLSCGAGTAYHSENHTTCLSCGAGTAYHSENHTTCLS